MCELMNSLGGQEDFWVLIVINRYSLDWLDYGCDFVGVLDCVYDVGWFVSVIDDVEWQFSCFDGIMKILFGQVFDSGDYGVGWYFLFVVVDFGY